MLRFVTHEFPSNCTLAFNCCCCCLHYARPSWESLLALHTRSAVLSAAVQAAGTALGKHEYYTEIMTGLDCEKTDTRKRNERTQHIRKNKVENQQRFREQHATWEIWAIEWATYVHAVCVPLGLDIFLAVRGSVSPSVCLSVVASTRQLAH